MKRVSAVVKEFQAMEMRKAVCIVCVAGGECIVATPLPYWMCGVDMVDIQSDKSIRGSSQHVQTDVTVTESWLGRVVSAIRRWSHAGSIAVSTPRDKLPKSSA